MNENELFSLDNFKKWIKGQNEFDSKLAKKFPIGEQVVSRVRPKKLEEVMTLENGQLSKVIKDFIKNGGKIKEVIDNEYLVEVTMGSFMVSKNYVKLD